MMVGENIVSFSKIDSTNMYAKNNLTKSSGTVMGSVTNFGLWKANSSGTPIQVDWVLYSLQTVVDKGTQ